MQDVVNLLLRHSFHEATPDAGSVTELASFSRGEFDKQTACLSHPNSLVYVATKGRQLIGVIIGDRFSFEEDYDDAIPLVRDRVVDINRVVHTDYQGKGVGTTMLLELMKEARKRGFDCFSAATKTTNTGAIMSLEKCGFKRHMELVGMVSYVKMPPEIEKQFLRKE